MMRIIWFSVAVFLTISPTHAGETKKFTYDAKGRVVKVERTGTVNNGVDTDYKYDKVQNRDRVKVAGVPPP